MPLVPRGSTQEEDDDEDLKPAEIDRNDILRKSVPRKAFIALRDPPIERRFTEVKEANFLDDAGPLELEERVSEDLATSAHEQETSSSSLSGSSSHPGVRSHVLSARELNQDTSPYPVFDSSGGYDDSLGYLLDGIKKVIKPSKSFANLLNSTSSSVSLGISTNSSCSSVGSISGLGEALISPLPLQGLSLPVPHTAARRVLAPHAPQPKSEAHGQGPGLLTVETRRANIFRSTPNKPEDIENGDMAEFVDSPVAAQTFPYPTVVETSVDTNHEELAPVSTDVRHCARLDVPGSRRLNSSRLDLNRTVLDDSTPDAGQNLNKTLLDESVYSEADVSLHATPTTALPEELPPVPVTSRPKLFTTESLFNFKKHKKVDLDCFASKPQAPRKVSLTSFQQDPSLQQEDEIHNRKLPDRFLGGDLLLCFDNLLDHCDGDDRSAVIATWMLVEGFLTPCIGKSVQFKAEQFYQVVRQKEGKEVPNRAKGQSGQEKDDESSDVLDEHNKKSFHLENGDEFENLKASYTELSKKFDEVQNELQRIRSLRSSDPIKNKKKGEKIVLVQDGENLKVGKSSTDVQTQVDPLELEDPPALRVSCPPPPPLPDSSCLPPPLTELPCPPPPPMLEILCPPPPPMLPGMGGPPPPPKLPGMGGPPPPQMLPGMGGPPPPPPMMPGMGGPPPPPPMMPGLGGPPPPPIMPGMGGPPPPPIMPGMGGPPPPPMMLPGMGGPPPPPMLPGMGGPPPPPMLPGMGGPPPPPMMPGMGGPPPPPMMPGMGGPPPPPMMPGLGGPPPPPMMPGPPPPPGMPGPPPLPGMPGPPPPPGMPGPPPPPGHFGRPSVAVWPAQRKPPIQPKTTMKPLYWARIQIPNVTPGIPSGVQGPLLWDQLDDVDVEGDVLEDLFGKAAPKPKEKTEEKEKKTEKVGVVKLIDGKKSQNIGIFLKSNKLDLDGVKTIVYDCDCSWEIEALVQLQGFQASPEEELPQLQLHMSTTPEKPLDKPDQFLWDLHCLSNFDARLICIMFQSTFSMMCEEVEIRLNNIKSCCNFLSTGLGLKKMLSVILACGNYMNGGNKQRGQADGFAIDILPKVKDVKTKDNSDNLLGFIVRFCIKNYDDQRGTPEAALPVPEPGDLEKCQNVDFEVERGECKRLQKELDMVKRNVDKIFKESPDDLKEPFNSRMGEFVEKAAASVTELTNHVEECARKFVECMRFYKFTPKKGKLEDVKPADFFSVWYLFCEDYKNTWKKEQVRIQAELVKEERRKQKMKKDSLKAEVEVKRTSVGGIKDKILRRKSRASVSMAPAEDQSSV